MINSKNIFKNFYNDIVVVAFSLLIFIVITTIISMTISGSRIDGMTGGIYWGLGLGVATFYYFRGQYSLLLSTIQATLNVSLTVLQFSGLDLLLGDSDLSKVAFGYVFIVVFIPTLLAINKQLLDYLTTKINGQKRNKKPIEIA